MTAELIEIGPAEAEREPPTEAQVAAFRRAVGDLAVEHRAKEALRCLMAAGPLATPYVIEGLRHPEPAVRIGCCVVLDHHMDERALPELIENLGHEDEMVRAWAMHALACDRCKEGACRPGEEQVLPIAARMLIEDKSRRVRQMAAGVLGPSVHRSELVLRALEHARDHDPHPVVRKIARWYTPGGTIYKRLMPKPARAPRGRAQGPGEATQDRPRSL
jgi:HEAT repeat protein